MITKRDLIIILATFCLTFALFTIVPVGSNYKTSGIGEYDPWIDPNYDGTVNILDCILISNHWDTTGTPLNKTELLNMNDTLAEILARIDSLNNTNAVLQSKVDNLTASLAETQIELGNLNNTDISQNSSIIFLMSKVDNLTASLAETQTKLNSMNATLTQQMSDLEDELYILNATKLGKPDFDSGWTAVILGDTLIPHTCNTTNVIVYMIGKQVGGTAQQKDYGGWQSSVGNWYGAYWYDLTDTHIRVHRHGNDGDWQMVRIFMWKIPQS